MKNSLNRRQFLELSAGITAAAAVGSTSLFLAGPSSTAFAATPLALHIAVTQAFPRTYTHIVKGNFADPQFATQGATDLFCYDRNANIGTFFATVQNGVLNNGNPVTSGLVQVGGNHTFSNRWSIIVALSAVQLLFYDATTGTGSFYSTDGQGNLTLQRTYTTFRTSWSQIIVGQFGDSNVLFYDAVGSTGQFYSVDAAGGMQLKHTNTDWRSSWASIITGRFSGSSFDDLLFYDRGAGFGAFYKFNSNGTMTLFSQHTNWRTSWKYVVSGDLGPNGSAGLLFYEDGTGFTEIDGVSTSGSLAQNPVSFPNQWSLPWQNIISGLFVPNTGFGQLINYDPTDGVMVSTYLFPIV